MPVQNDLVPRHKILAFYGVNVSGDTYEYYRMRFFTELGMTKNPNEYSRKYVDEATERTDITAYTPEISYAFDKYRSDSVLDDIIRITNEEKLGSDAVRQIIWVDTETGAGILRRYTVVPDSEGGDSQVYTYSGKFKANSEPTKVTATTANDWSTITYTEV